VIVSVAVVVVEIFSIKAIPGKHHVKQKAAISKKNWGVCEVEVVALLVVVVVVAMTGQEQQLQKPTS